MRPFETIAVTFVGIVAVAVVLHAGYRVTAGNEAGSHGAHSQAEASEVRPLVKQPVNPVSTSQPSTVATRPASPAYRQAAADEDLSLQVFIPSEQELERLSRAASEDNG
jgi:hypothetical protein